MIIKKPALVEQLMKEYGYTRKSATSLVDDFTDVVMYNLRNGNEVALYGFGRFILNDRKARRCPNPATGKLMDIPSHWVPKFIPGRSMRFAVSMYNNDMAKGSEN